MRGVFRGGGGGVSGDMNADKPGDASPIGFITRSEAAPAPAAVPEPTLGTSMQQQPTSRIVNRASTMLSNRRAGDDVRVGTKKLLGQ